MSLPSTKHSRSLVHLRGGSEYHSMARLFRFGAMVEYHPISAEDTPRLHQFGPKVLPGIFFEYVLSAGGIWKGDIMVADNEELEQMDASELHARRLNAKEVLKSMKGENFIFPVTDGTVKISGEDQDLRTSTLIRDNPDRGEQDNLRGESDGSSSTPRQDSSLYDVKPNKIFGLFQEISLTVITWTPSQTVRADWRIIHHSTEIH